MAKKAVKKTAKKIAKKATVKTIKNQKTDTIASSPMINDVKQLVGLMMDNDLSELNIEEGSRKILLKRGPVAALAAAAVPAVQVVESAAPAAEKEQASAADDFIEVKSPMVGTFYSSASPDSDLYVTVGDTVGADDVVCIVEAMKVMNEIKAECTGKIAEICVKNAQPVEFGQVLFRVKPV